VCVLLFKVIGTTSENVRVTFEGYKDDGYVATKYSIIYACHKEKS